MTGEMDPNRPAVGPPPRRFGRARSGARRIAPFIAGVAATFLAIVLYGTLNPGTPALTTQDVDQAVASILASQTPPPPRAELVYAAIQPSIVLIDAKLGGSAAAGATPAPTPAPSPGGKAPNTSLGTGVIVSDAGTILTALHVVSGSTSIQVTFADGSTANAAIASTQPENDIAVLQPDRVPANLAPATLGNPNAMRIGSDAYIVGNPFGLYGSLSAGVVSGLNRSFQPNGGPEIKGLIQVDAAINPGNSGGPLLDRNGQVVGIVTALVNPTGQDVFIGIGLAVPIDVAGGAAGLPAY